MKKKNLWAILATVIMALPLFVGFGGTSVNAAGEEIASIVVHKVENTGDSIVNTGRELDGNYKTISGVEFSIYDITENPKGEGTLVEGPVPTGTDGTVHFDNLPKTKEIEVDGKKVKVYTKYRIVEGDGPEYVTGEKAEDIKVEFPVYALDLTTNEPSNDETDELDEIHVYPKNEVFGAAPKFEKYSRVGNGGDETALADAEFKMYRLKEDGTKEYLQVLPEKGTPSDITWDIKDTAETFISDANGVVSVEDKNANYKLPAGTYYFEETKTASNEYELPSDYVISVVIGKDKDDEPTFDYTVNPNYASKDDVKDRVVNQSAKITKERLSKGDSFDYDKPIDYKVTVDVPKAIASDYSQFNVTDTPNENLVFDESSLMVVSLTEKIILTKDVDYRLTPNSTYPDFKIDFDIDAETDGLQLSDAVKGLNGKTLVITYKMSIKQGAPVDTEFNNNATLNLTPNPTTPPEPVVPVETYGKKFMKVDSADNNKALDGAKFAVKNANGTKYLTLADGKYVWVDLPKGTDLTIDTENLVILESDDGAFEIKGLQEGTYKLEELVAPDGYATLLNDIDFTVTADGYNDPKAIMDVANTQKGKLPSTGGTGIIAFVAIGVVAVAGAVLYFTKGRRQIEG